MGWWLIHMEMKKKEEKKNLLDILANETLKKEIDSKYNLSLHIYDTS
jgi:hypothetical protein